MIIPEVQTSKKKIKISEIIFNPEFYARFEPNQRLISDYEENAEEILNSDNHIQLSENYILIDGYHRWKALERVYGKEQEITVLIHHTENTDYLLLKSYAGNTKHGLRNKRDENKKNIRNLYVRGYTLEQIQQHLGLGKSLVFEATTEDRKKEKEERDKKIVDLYLKAENTYKSISEILNIDEATVIKIMKNSTSGKYTRKHCG